MLLLKRIEKIGWEELVILISLVWLCLCFALAVSISESLTKLFILWALCVADLILLGKTVAKVLAMMSDTRHQPDESGQLASSRSSLEGVTLVFWGLGKFVAFLLLGFMVFHWSKVLSVGLLVAVVSILLVVPLFGGLFWSRLDASRRI